MAGLLRASEEGLRILDIARRNPGWNKTGDAWCQAALTSKATLKRQQGEHFTPPSGAFFPFCLRFIPFAEAAIRTPHTRHWICPVEMRDAFR